MSRLFALADLALFFPGVLDLPGRVAPRTLTEYRFDVQHYLAWCGYEPERAIDPQTFRAWLQHMVENTTFSPHTINRRYAAVQSLVKASADCEQLDHALAYRFSLVKPVGLSQLRHRIRRIRPKAFTSEEVRALFRAVDPTTLIGLRDRAMLGVLATSGCRIAEVVTLRQSDLVPFGTETRLRVLGKGQHTEREAPLSREAVQWVRLWLRERRDKGGVNPDVLFSAFDSQSKRPVARPLTTGTVWYRLKRYARAAGLPSMSPHDLRRFVGTQVAARHGLRAAQLALGHKRLETTVKHYVLDEMPSGLTENLF